LSVTAPQLHVALGDYTAVRRWDLQVRAEARRRLGIVVAVLGAEEPFREQDIRALPHSTRTIGAGWLL
jgi:hypothetical protein